MLERAQRSSFIGTIRSERRSKMAFRRDFTINALCYDVATFSIIDYVNGLDDLRAGIVRSIGDPEERFREDPVRMLRAIALGARLDFEVDPPILKAIRRQRGEIALSSPARLIEEYYKILRSGYAEKTFRRLTEAGLIEPVAAELHAGAAEPLWQSLRSLDVYRGKFQSIPETFTNPCCLAACSCRSASRGGHASYPVPERNAPPPRAIPPPQRQALGLPKATISRRVAHGLASYRWRGVTSTVSGRFSDFNGASAISARARARSAR